MIKSFVLGLCLLSWAVVLAASEVPQAVAGAGFADFYDLPAGDYSRLKKDFNDAAGNIRLLFLLSPTCPPCRDGARVMQTEVLEKVDSDRLKIFAVWFGLLDSDNREAAEFATTFLNDPRVVNYWLPDRSLGDLYGQILEFPSTYAYKVAVDVYLLFDEKVEWRDGVPVPSFWMHQLGSDARRLDGNQLRASVQSLIRERELRNDGAPRRRDQD